MTSFHFHGALQLVCLCELFYLLGELIENLELLAELPSSLDGAPIFSEAVMDLTQGTSEQLLLFGHWMLLDTVGGSWK